MYIPLYVKTNYSLLSSLITIDNYINYAKEHNYSRLVITDNNIPIKNNDFFVKKAEIELQETYNKVGE